MRDSTGTKVKTTSPYPNCAPLCTPHTPIRAFPQYHPIPCSSSTKGDCSPLYSPSLLEIKKQLCLGLGAEPGWDPPPHLISQAWAQVSDAQDQITHHSGQDIIPYYQFHANSSALARIKSQLKNLAFQGERKMRGGIFVGFLLVSGW